MYSYKPVRVCYGCKRLRYQPRMIYGQPYCKRCASIILDKPAVSRNQAWNRYNDVKNTKAIRYSCRECGKTIATQLAYEQRGSCDECARIERKRRIDAMIAMDEMKPDGIGHGFHG